MSNSAESTLQKAYELIENNQLAEARDLIQPLLESNRDNPAVWWIYAHAVDDPDEGRAALDQVLKLDPTYPGATEIHSRISLPAPESPRGVIKKLQKQESTADVDDWDDMEFDEDSSRVPQGTRRRRSPLRLILLAVVAIVLIILAFLLLSGGGGTPSSPTSVAGNPTSAPTLDIQIVVTTPEETEEIETIEPTEESATATSMPEPTETIEVIQPTDEPEMTEAVGVEDANAEGASSSLDTLQKALSAYDVAPEDIITRSTLLGQTLQVKVCSPLGPQSSVTLNEVMQIFVKENTSLPPETEAVAVSLVDCDQNGFPRTIGVDMETVRGLSDGTLTLKDFQREWQPLP